MAKLDNNQSKTWAKELQTKYDMNRWPQKQMQLLRPLTWLLSQLDFMKRKLTIKKVNLEGLKQPYLILSNHMAFLDFKVLTKTIFPQRTTYVIAIDGFIKREGLLRAVGGICKRKFTNDIVLVRHMLYALHTLKQNVALYPEARYTLAGTTSVLPGSLAKMCKLAKVPIVTCIMNGNYLDQPVWGVDHRRGNDVAVTFHQIITKEEILSLSLDEIKRRIEEAFVYDEYQWQKEQGILIHDPKNAEGLHRILYQCPHCLQEGKMNSKGTNLFCENCGHRYQLCANGDLQAEAGETKFNRVPDWFEWQRANVRQEIIEGRYHIEDEVHIDSLPNAKGFIPLGNGKLRHNQDGFYLTWQENGEEKQLHNPVAAMYSVHIEYNYNEKGDCVDLTTLTDNYYCYFKNLKNVVTKIHFATEELFKLGGYRS